MHYLNQVKQYILTKSRFYKDIPFNYVIPDIFDGFNLAKDKKIGQTQRRVNPFEFTISTIEKILSYKKDPLTNDLIPYYLNHQSHHKSGEWIKDSIVYSLMIRSSTSYDHDRSYSLDLSNLYGLKETGTFLKTIWLLPFLRKMGVDVLYLLPISKYSMKDKKGEAGSPYSVSNFKELDPFLKDPLTGKECPIEVEFKALIEAAHLLDMKVIIDIIPRTNSVNSDLILSHPEWFYWIKKEHMNNYKPPFVPLLDEPKVADKKYFDALFSSDFVQKHLSYFVVNPKENNPIQWNLMLDYKKNHPHIEPLDLIDQFFDCSVAYAFSDIINDPQPAWNDVTYFRLYLDHPENSVPYLDKYNLNPAPYLLYDVAKSSMNPGKIPNKPLWDELSDLLPYYQREFGIDGARIDMGHALPEDLVHLIISKAKQVNPHFCFIAEELDIHNDEKSKDQGYHMIIGDGFMNIPKVDIFGYHKFFYQTKQLKTPVFACGETHDTPRLAAFEGNKIIARSLTLMNFFVPNAIPFINSGQEFYEIAPMNLGLGARENEQYLLDKDDLFYGKLALFDYVGFHMDNPDRFEIMSSIEMILPIREKYLECLHTPKLNYYLDFDHPHIKAVSVALEKENSCLIALCHTNYHHDDSIVLHCQKLPERFKNARLIHEVYSTDDHNPARFYFDENKNIIVFLKAGEFKLIELLL